MINSEHPLLLIFFILLCISTALQLYFYLYFYLAAATYRHEAGLPVTDPVSVIICARNEEENLRNYLPAILEQDYPDFEVIVVNDCSEDNTYDVLGKYLKKYPNLKVSNIFKDPKFTHSKKFAQFIGIKASKNEILLFTDADCKPESALWLATMVSHFNGKTDFVIGYGGYFKRKGVLNKYIRYDVAVIAMQYLGMAIRGFPYMGVGRNLAYRRSLFFNKRGFGNYSHLISGDDDLFVNSHSTKENLSVEFRKDAHTRSVPSATLKELIKQKRRHLTTAVHYKTRDKVILVAEPGSRIIFYSLFVVLFACRFMWPYLLALFLIRLTVQVVVAGSVQRKLNEPGLLLWTLVFDIFSPLINLILYFSNFGIRKDNLVWN